MCVYRWQIGAGSMFERSCKGPGSVSRDESTMQCAVKGKDSNNGGYWMKNGAARSPVASANKAPNSASGLLDYPTY